MVHHTAFGAILSQLEVITAKPPLRRFSEYDDSTLTIMASQGVHGAFKERMLREVMRRDNVSFRMFQHVLDLTSNLLHPPFPLDITGILWRCLPRAGPDE